MNLSYSTINNKNFNWDLTMKMVVGIHTLSSVNLKMKPVDLRLVKYKQEFSVLLCMFLLLLLVMTPSTSLNLLSLKIKTKQLLTYHIVTTTDWRIIINFVIPLVLPVWGDIKCFLYFFCLCIFWNVFQLRSCHRKYGLCPAWELEAGTKTIIGD